MNPLDWTAGPFLLFYAVVAVSALILAVLLRPGRWRRTSNDAAGLNALQAAYLAGGPERAADTALVGLLEHGAVAFTAGGLVPASTGPGLPAALQPYAAIGRAAASRTGFQQRAAGLLAQLQDGLARRGLAPPAQARRRYHKAIAVLVAALLVLGAAKVVVGLSRGHPVGFLLFLMVLTGVLGIKLGRAPFSTAAGSAALAGLRRLHARAARAPVEQEVVLAFALTGAAVLAGRSFHRMFVPASSGGWDNGDGGSSGSSDSGGGGGGGGCGGCS